MPTNVASFLSLPVELRLAIYKLLFNRYNPGLSRNILLANRQIRLEAFPVYLEWTRYFSSFENLIEWTTAGNPHLIEHVRDVSIMILDHGWDKLRNAATQASKEEAQEEVEPNTAGLWKRQLAQIGDPLPHQHPGREGTDQSRSRLMRLAHDLRKVIGRQRELSVSQVPETDLICDIWTALLRMPNVRHCWVNLSHPDARMEPLTHTFLEMISIAFPRMATFTFFSHIHNLEFLRNFKYLRLLRFTGRSTCTPHELLAILLSLKSLDSLSLYRYPETYDRERGISLNGYLALTEPVIAGIQPLRTLEISHMSNSAPSDFLTLPMLEAWRCHLPSLRELKIGTDERLGATAVTELLDLIAHSHLTKLQIRSQGDKKPLDISSYLPDSLKHCDAALKCDDFKGTGTSGGGQFHNHTFTEIELQDPQFRGILEDSFSRQLLH